MKIWAEFIAICSLSWSCRWPESLLQALSGKIVKLYCLEIESFRDLDTWTRELAENMENFRGFGVDAMQSSCFERDSLGLAGFFAFMCRFGSWSVDVNSFLRIFCPLIEIFCFCGSSFRDFFLGL